MATRVQTGTDLGFVFQTSFTISFPLAPTSGNLMLASIGYGQATTIWTPEPGWTIVGDSVGSGTRATIFAKISDGTEPASNQAVATSSENLLGAGKGMEYSAIGDFLFDLFEGTGSGTGIFTKDFDIQSPEHLMLHASASTQAIINFSGVSVVFLGSHTGGGQNLGLSEVVTVSGSTTQPTHSIGSAANSATAVVQFALEPAGIPPGIWRRRGR